MAKTMRKHNKKSRRPRRRNVRKTRRGGDTKKLPSTFFGSLFGTNTTKGKEEIKPYKLPADRYAELGIEKRTDYNMAIQTYLSGIGIDDLGSDELNIARIKTILDILKTHLPDTTLRTELKLYTSNHGTPDIPDFYNTRIQNALISIKVLIKKCEKQPNGLTPERISRIKTPSDYKGQFSSNCQ